MKVRGKAASGKKLVFIVAQLIETSDAYDGKSNADIEKEIFDEMPDIPYVVRVEKVTVLDCPG